MVINDPRRIKLYDLLICDILYNCFDAETLKEKKTRDSIEQYTNFLYGFDKSPYSYEMIYEAKKELDSLSFEKLQKILVEKVIKTDYKPIVGPKYGVMEVKDGFPPYSKFDTFFSRYEKYRFCEWDDEEEEENESEYYSRFNDNLEEIEKINEDSNDSGDDLYEELVDRALLESKEKQDSRCLNLGIRLPIDIDYYDENKEKKKEKEENKEKENNNKKSEKTTTATNKKKPNKDDKELLRLIKKVKNDNYLCLFNEKNEPIEFIKLNEILLENNFYVKLKKIDDDSITFYKYLYEKEDDEVIEKIVPVDDPLLILVLESIEKDNL